MPPKSKKKKIVWNNNDCKADVCKRPEFTSTWVKCDECKGWYHCDCVQLNPDKLQPSKEWFCPSCFDLKKEEYLILKERLLSKVEDLAQTQEKFGGHTIHRDMFKVKKNATSFNFSTDFPPTLLDLCKRIQSKFITMSDFRFEYKLMCKKLISELLDNYASQVQFVEFELDDIYEEICREEEPEPEPEPEPSPPPSPKVPENNALSIKQEKLNSNTLDLGVSSITTEEDTSDIENHYIVPENNVAPQSPEHSDKFICNYCSKNFTEFGIYSCKRNHQLCANCRMMIPGCICPVCYNEFGDRKRLAIDHSANILFSYGKNGNNATHSKIIKTAIARARRGRGKSTQGGWSVGEEMTSRVTEESQQNTLNIGIGRVWSCKESSDTSASEQLGAAQIKKENHHSSEETPSLDMTTMITDTQVDNMLTMINADVCAVNDDSDSKSARPKQAPKKRTRIKKVNTDKVLELHIPTLTSKTETRYSSGVVVPHDSDDHASHTSTTQKDELGPEDFKVLVEEINKRAEEIKKLENIRKRTTDLPLKEFTSKRILEYRSQIEDLRQHLPINKKSKPKRMRKGRSESTEDRICVPGTSAKISPRHKINQIPQLSHISQLNCSEPQTSGDLILTKTESAILSPHSILPDHDPSESFDDIAEISLVSADGPDSSWKARRTSTNILDTAVVASSSGDDVKHVIVGTQHNECILSPTSLHQSSSSTQVISIQPQQQFSQLKQQQGGLMSYYPVSEEPEDSMNVIDVDMDVEQLVCNSVVVDTGDSIVIDSGSLVTLGVLDEPDEVEDASVYIEDAHNEDSSEVVDQLRQSLECSSYEFDRKKQEDAGCRCEDVSWQDNMHFSRGTLFLNLLSNCNANNLEWKTFLSVYAPSGPPMYHFEVGRGPQVFYIRAFSHIKSCHKHRWNISFVDPSVELSGVFTNERESIAEPLPPSVNINSALSYVIAIVQ